MLDSEDKIRSFYQDSLTKHGMTPQGMAYADKSIHFKRLNKVQEIVEMLAPYSAPSHILDVGCGYGLLPMEWEAEGYMRPDSTTIYYGVDVVPEYIEDAQLMHRGHPDCYFYLSNYLDMSFDPIFDITLAIGTFAYQPITTVQAMIYKMWRETMSGGVMVFNNLPDAPLSKSYVNWLSKDLSAAEFLWYEGYSTTILGEGIAAYVKR